MHRVFFVIAVACFLKAFVPQWVSAKIRIRLEKSLVFSVALAVLVPVYFFVVMLRPEVPLEW